MTRPLIAALALIWVIGADANAAQTAPGHFGVPYWKPVGAWIVLLIPLSSGSFSCAALTRAVASGSGKYSVGFALTASTTHFYLNDPALPKPAPKSVTLAVDQHQVARLPVLLHQRFDRGGQILMADVPGMTLGRRILPAMIAGRQLEVDAGDRHYAVSIADFGVVVKQLQECALFVLGPLSGMPSGAR